MLLPDLRFAALMRHNDDDTHTPRRAIYADAARRRVAGRFDVTLRVPC